MKIDESGVPQGSILGPLLFLIFVNDLNDSTKVLDPVLFADDTNIFCSYDNISTLFKTANQELNQINDYFLANKPFLNVEKTKYMLIHKLTVQDNIPFKLPSLQLNGNIIERENSLKFLGAILYEHLTWKKYIQLIENKVSKNVGVLYKTSKVINSKYLRSIYFPFIHSYINYANIAWASTNKTKLYQINYLSNRKQFIKYGDKQTNIETITCGVPQGSILGPLLFLIFVNDLHKEAKYLDPIMFADDTNLFCSHKNIKTLFQIVNNELRLVTEWFLANKLSLNAKKAKYVLF